MFEYLELVIGNCLYLASCILVILIICSFDNFNKLCYTPKSSKKPHLSGFRVASSKLQAIGGFYLLPSIRELFSRYGRFGFGWVVPRFCSFFGGPTSDSCLQIIGIMPKESIAEKRRLSFCFAKICELKKILNKFSN